MDYVNEEMIMKHVVKHVYDIEIVNMYGNIVIWTDVVLKHVILEEKVSDIEYLAGMLK